MGGEGGMNSVSVCSTIQFGILDSVSVYNSREEAVGYGLKQGLPPVVLL